MRQRLFVARELFKQPNLLILDEAPSALRTPRWCGQLGRSARVQQSIDALWRRGDSRHYRAPPPRAIKNVDRVYVMDAGRVMEERAYEDLRSNGPSRFHERVERQRL